MTVALPVHRPTEGEPDRPEPHRALTAATGSALECARALLALQDRRRRGLDACPESVREVLATARALVLELTMALRDEQPGARRKS
jgi:hypothetical protein